jgi:serine/threonine protein kinase
VEGTPFGRYRLVELLGRGGMGEVWRANDPDMNRVVALKVLPVSFANDQVFRERFRREAWAAAGLDEPHVVPIYEFGEVEGRLYVTMRLIKGHDLQELLERGSLEPTRAVGIIEQIASALHAAHRIELVHRDVKPSNILVAEDDFAYLIDFGIARASEDTQITSTGATVGTWAYMAPERFRTGAADASADIYALTCVLHQALTGQIPFPGNIFEQIAAGHLFEPPPRPSKLTDGVSTKMDDVIATGMAKRPDQRYATTKDLAEAARAALSTKPVGKPSGKPAAKRAAIPPRTVDLAAAKHDEPVDDATRRRPWIVAAATAVVLVVIGGLLLAWRPWQTHQPTATSAQTTPGPSTSMVGVPPPVSTTTSAMPPPLFSAKSIDRVLLTADQLSRLLGADVTDNPAAAGGGAVELSLNSSSYGTSDHSGQVTPRSCVGVVFTAEHEVYAANEPAAIKRQTFGHLYGSGGHGPHLIEQAAAVFTSAAQAQAFLTSSQDQWETCAKGQVNATFGFENGAGYTLGSVQRQGDLITVAMASPGGENPPDACQQALGVRENVVVEARTCEIPNVTTSSSINGADPAWAVPDAERVAKAMLENVAP